MADDRRTPPRKSWPLSGPVSTTPEPAPNDSAARMKLAESGPMGGITKRMLRKQAHKLEKVTEVGTPFADNLFIKRDGLYKSDLTSAVKKDGSRKDNRPHTPAQFIDFVVETRRHLTALAETSAGRDLFAAIEKHGEAKRIKIKDAGKHRGLRESQVPTGGSRFPAQRDVDEEDGVTKIDPGEGTGSTVYHHANIGQRWRKIQEVRDPSAKKRRVSPKKLDGGIGMSGAIALGHELIHAARAQAGLQAPGVAANKLPFEEIETVGHPDGSRTFPEIPTENALRKALSEEVYKGGTLVKEIQPRTRYAGKKL